MKNGCQVIRSAAPVTQNHLIKPPDLRLQNATSLRKSALLTSLMNMSVALRLPREMHLCRSSANAPRLPSFLEMPQNPHVLVLLTFDKVPKPLRLPRKTTSERPKVLRTRQFLTLLTSKCASHHNGVQLFISHLTTWLRTRRFSEPTFRPSGATNHKSLGKHSVARLCYLFAHLQLLSSDSFSSLIFFLLFFSSLTLPTSAFHLSILSEV